ncbi:MAG: hypothetical protein HRT66_13930 [Flavobacteriaceae bacterium]|nr:hypothetical protein [Flavobacteriaceae bacterium]
MKKSLLSLFFLSLIVNCYAQENHSLYSLRGYVGQAQNISVSSISPYKVSVSIPVLNLGMTLWSETAYSYAFKENDKGGLSLDLNRFANEVSEKNSLYFGTNINLINISFKSKRGSMWSVFSNIKSKNYIEISKTVLGFITEGTSYNSGNIDLSNLFINTVSYTEHGIGYSGKFLEDKLTAGIRLKYINGLAHIGINDEMDLRIKVDPNTSFWSIYTENTQLNTSLLNSSDISSFLFNSGNKGFGIDLGGKYQIDDKISAEISINDLGSIRWKTEVKNFVLNDIDYTFKGINLNPEEEEESTEDELEDIFETTENNNSFTTGLVTSVYLTGNYQLSRQNRLSLSVFNQFNRRSIRPELIIAYNRTMRNTTIGILGSFSSKKKANLGLNLSTNLGFLQWYLAFDNILGGLKPQNAHLFTFNTGFNFIFGKVKKPKLIIKSLIISEPHR